MSLGMRLEGTASPPLLLVEIDTRSSLMPHAQ